MSRKMNMLKPVLLAFAGLLVVAACCPKGTVPCTKIILEVDTKTGKMRFEKKKTCTQPGACPIDKMATSQLEPSIDELFIEAYVAKLAEGQRLDPASVKLKVASRGWTGARIISAALDAAVRRKDAAGWVLQETHLSVPLAVVADTGSTWVLSPLGGDEFDRFVREAAQIFLDGDVPEIEWEYSLDLVFDDLSEEAAEKGIDSELVIGYLVW